MPQNFSIACGQWFWNWLIVEMCFGVEHNASEGLKEFWEKMLAREMELEDCIPREAALQPQVLVLILRHAQI